MDVRYTDKFFALERLQEEAKRSFMSAKLFAAKHS